MKKFSFIILLFFIISCPVLADVYKFPSNFESISKQIPKIHSIKCKFKQEKHLQNISKPLISSGDFEFVENKGVYFHTLYPFESTVDYTNKNYKQINDIINAISAKKYSILEREFYFFYEGNINKWTLVMKPKKNSNAYNYISSITLNGADYINKIIIKQTNGNMTTLWFTK